MRIINYSRIKRHHLLEVGRARLVNKPWTAGGLLLLCVVVAMLMANLPFTKDIYHAFLHTKLSMSIQSPADTVTGQHVIDWIFPKDMTVEKFINDILMVVFFFTVGLEIKREIVCGELSSPKKAMLPVIAAAGGMIMPAIIYGIVNHGNVASSGWGIPTATDIAFAMGLEKINFGWYLKNIALVAFLGYIAGIAVLYLESLYFF